MLAGWMAPLGTRNYIIVEVQLHDTDAKERERRTIHREGIQVILLFESHHIVHLFCVGILERLWL